MIFAITVIMVKKCQRLNNDANLGIFLHSCKFILRDKPKNGQFVKILTFFNVSTTIFPGNFPFLAQCREKFAFSCCLSVRVCTSTAQVLHILPQNVAFLSRNLHSRCITWCTRFRFLRFPSRTPPPANNDLLHPFKRIKTQRLTNKKRLLFGADVIFRQA